MQAFAPVVSGSRRSGRSGGAGAAGEGRRGEGREVGRATNKLM